MEHRVRDVLATMESLLAPAPTRGRGSVIADLVKRAEEPSVIDGYPRGGGGERVSGSGDADPTMATVAARQADVCGRCIDGLILRRDGSTYTCPQCGGSGRRWADPVADAIAEIERLLIAAARQARDIDRQRAKINATTPKVGRTSSLQGNCVVCGVMVTGAAEDRLKRGMDNACYLAWGSWKIKNETDDPGADFHRFTIWRQDKLAEKERAEHEAAEHERRAGRR